MRQFIITLLLCLSISVYAQKAPFKFGKIEKEEIAVNQCDFYPEAHSMILGAYGNLRFIYADHDDRFKYQMEVIIRKKIFNKVDKDAGSFKIKFYDPSVAGNSKEEISGLKAYTYNIVDGKVEKTKLSKSDQYENRLNDYWQEISVAMPNVQEGSVIEYTYTITSDLISNLQTWHFQSDIPVKYSEFRVKMPEFYNYQVSTVGNAIPLEHEQKSASETFRYSYYYDEDLVGPGGHTRKKKAYANLPSQSLYRRFVARNIKPVIDEPYTNNKVDLPSRVEFQLIFEKFPNSPVNQIAKNYDDFNKTLLDHFRFGDRLSKGNFAKDYLSTLEGTGTLEKAASVYSWIQKNMVWDGYNSLFSETAGGPAFRDGKGNVADINLTLVAALKEAGINAFPVLLSTRGNGVPHPIYPSFDHFNFVVALIKVDDQVFMMDASSNLPFGMLPAKCLNDKGWVVHESGGSWMNMKLNNPHQLLTMVQTNILEDRIENKVQLKKEYYASINNYNSMKKDGEDKFQESLAGSFPEWEFNDFSLESNSVAKGVSYSFTLSKERNDDDIIYLQPLLIGTEKENPFIREERFSMVDFEYRYSKRVFNTITIPEGYTAELPEPGIIKLPGDAGTFTYNVKQVGNNIQLISDFQLNKTEYTSEEYAHLKQFYQLMVEKNNAMIIIKKI